MSHQTTPTMVPKTARFAQPSPRQPVTIYDSTPGAMVYPPGMQPRETPVVPPSPAPLAPSADAASQVEPSSDHPLPPTPNELRGRGVWVNRDVAIMLAVAWLLTIGMAFLFGRTTAASPHGATPSASLAARDDLAKEHATAREGDTGRTNLRVERSVPPPERPPAAGEWVIVLASAARDGSGDVEKQFLERAKKDNEAAAKTEGRFPCYFGVRKTRSGGIQYIFGEVNRVPGIARTTDTEGHLEILKRTFKDATWRKLSD